MSTASVPRASREDAFQQLFMNIQCEPSWLPLQSAVTIFPCCHKINAEFAERYFGAKEKDSFSISRNCPLCNNYSLGYHADHVMRTIVEQVLLLRLDYYCRKQENIDILSRVIMQRRSACDETSVSLISQLEVPGSGFKKCLNILVCPVFYEPLTFAVTLFPCCHKMNEGVVAQLPLSDGGIKDAPFVKHCPICQGEILESYVDNHVRTILQNIVQAKADNHAIKEKNFEIIQRLVEQKISINDLNVASEIIELCPRKLFKAQTLQRIAQIMVRRNQLDEAKKVAESILDSKIKIETILFISNAIEQVLRNKEQDARIVASNQKKDCILQ